VPRLLSGLVLTEDADDRNPHACSTDSHDQTEQEYGGVAGAESSRGRVDRLGEKQQNADGGESGAEPADRGAWTAAGRGICRLFG
jgi:hypothetical protein